MSWEHTRHLKRSICCSGDQLRFFRQRLGWTQEHLASLAGYSDRLIRKAEAGQAIHPDTVEVLAQSLSTPEITVHPEDLICSPSEIAKLWGRAYREKGRQLTSQYQHYLDEEIDFFFAGDPNEIPFAGTWKGIAGFDQAWQAFFDVFDRIDRQSYIPQCVAEGTSVVTLAHAKCFIRGTDIAADSWVCMRFEFQRGRITSIKDFYDTQLTADLLQQAQLIREPPSEEIS